jgi:hypothetical protein
MINEKYSFIDCTGQSLKKVSTSELNNTTIKGTCFSQEEPDTDIFPAGMTGLTFEGCNLENVVIPSGNIAAKDCVTWRVKVQNDGMFWEIDKSNQPITPADEVTFDKFGISKDPKDIPASKLAQPIINGKEKVT